MKRMLLVMAVLMLGLTLAFAQGGKEASSQAESVTLTVYSPGNVNSVPTKTILKYKELVEAASNGSIKLIAHHSGELGNDAEALQSTRMGTIDIIFAGTSGFTSFY
ncbi:MAG: C4-dicarboxylate ABC transporter, partial [Sphaerochaeta sp.]|nr:C4-dicarboxylate ABC transporter [Sphaerochaeta sp.]